MAYLHNLMLMLGLFFVCLTLTNAQASNGITLDAECGVSKGCFSDCTSSSCSFLVTWKEDGDNGVYSLMADGARSSGSWIALGFSADSGMGDDGVHGCESDANGNVIVFSTINPVRDNPTRNIYDDSEVVLTAHNINNNVLSCTFTRPKSASSNGRVDVTQPWTLLFAKGPGTIRSGKAQLEDHGSNKWVSPGRYRVSDTTEAVATDLNFPLVKAHGSLMIVAWIFLASIGVVAARYYKPVWADLMCSQKVWFQIHRTCMILVLATTTAGFIIIFCEVKGWSDLDHEEKTYLQGHPIMGIIVMALTLLNPVMALFRPHPGTPRRPIFNWAHWFVGTAAHILGVVTIFFGVLLSRAGAPHYLIYILAGYVAWQVLVELTLELLSCYGRKQAKRDEYEMSDRGALKPEPSIETDLTRLIKRIIFVVHMFVVTAVAAVLIALLVVGKMKLDD